MAAIPARNEAAEIQGCLQALAGQREARLDAVVVCVNNSEDDTVSVLAAIAPSLPFSLEVIEATFPPEDACAGLARRAAMDRAASLAGADGVIVTTDADGRACPDWLEANLAAIAGGAEAVAGRADIEPEGAKMIPAHLHEADAAECAYAAALDEIAALLDPDPADPWPRHDQHSGASIAVTVAAYRRAGGMPAARLAEDRLFIDALRRVDARIRHAPEACVIVSARTVGRAPGGMADTIRRRMTCMDAFLDDRLEPARDAAQRASLRAQARMVWRAGWQAGWQAEADPGAPLAAALGLERDALASLLAQPWFGTAWKRLESASPRLCRRVRVAVTDLDREARQARHLLRQLRPLCLLEQAAARSPDAEPSPPKLAGGAEMPLPAAAAPA